MTAFAVIAGRDTVARGYLPVTRFTPIQGGTAGGNAEAQADSWRRMLHVLDVNLLHAPPPRGP